MENEITNTHGGKREGSGRKKAYHTIQTEAAKAALIKAYVDNIKPINAALVRKASRGDIQAIRELHDRVYGKAPQAVINEGEMTIKILRLDA